MPIDCVANQQHQLQHGPQALALQNLRTCDECIRCMVLHTDRHPSTSRHAASSSVRWACSSFASDSNRTQYNKALRRCTGAGTAKIAMKKRSTTPNVVGSPLKAFTAFRSASLGIILRSRVKSSADIWRPCRVGSMSINMSRIAEKGTCLRRGFSMRVSFLSWAGRCSCKKHLETGQTYPCVQTTVTSNTGKCCQGAAARYHTSIGSPLAVNQSHHLLSASTTLCCWSVLTA